MNNKKLMLLDGFSLANRAFFALPPLATSAGQPTNAVYGLTMMLLKLLKESNPDYILMAFDVAAPTFRHQEYQAYKGQRLKMEDTLKVQFPIIRQLLAILKIPIVEQAGYEADDIIGTMAKKAAKQGITVEIVTGDRDAFQLVEPQITVLYTRKGITETDRVDEQYIFNRYQLKPEQLIDLKSLMGDSSDNIPGITGFGEKTALKYLHQYQSLTGIYQHLDEITRDRDKQLLNQYHEQADLSRHLATIVTNVELEVDPINCCHHKEYSKQELIDFCKTFEFHSLANKLSDGEETIEKKQLPELTAGCQIMTEADLERVVAVIREEGSCFIQFFTTVANWAQVGLQGLGLGTLSENWFYPTTTDAGLPPILRDLLEDQYIAKYGHDLKKQMQIALNLGIEIDGNLEDLLIAGYLVNSGLGGLELEDLSSVYLQKLIYVWRNERGKVFSVFNLPADLSLEV
jgi:DNA polymerase-1